MFPSSKMVQVVVCRQLFGVTVVLVPRAAQDWADHLRDETISRMWLCVLVYNVIVFGTAIYFSIDILHLLF